MPATDATTNASRRLRAARALHDNYRGSTRLGMIDAITDFMHLAQATGIDFERVLQMARIHHREEQRD